MRDGFVAPSDRVMAARLIASIEERRPLVTAVILRAMEAEKRSQQRKPCVRRAHSSRE